MTKQTIKSVVLAYSGGLDTSAIIPWLKEHYNCDVHAFVADVGQGDDELSGIEEKALLSGAASCHVVDLKEEFVRDYIYPTLKTGAVYEADYLLGTAMARPVIAKAQVELALKLGADAVSHGCTGKGNDQVRFESTFAALAPHLKVVAPWREWSMQSREDLLDYLAEKNIPTTASATKIYSRDANAWHISHEGGELEDPWCQPSEQVWTWTRSPEQAPDYSDHVHIKIEKGEIVAVDQQPFSPYQALVYLNEKAAKHGIGRIDIVENRLVGMKSRGCYETPGGTVMNAALRGLETLVYDKSMLKFRESLGQEFAHLVYDGRWFTPLKDSVLAGTFAFSDQLTGEVVLKLYKGQCSVIQRQSPNSLYAESFATFGEDDVYNQADAEGFIRLYSLPSRIAALQAQQASTKE